MSAPLEKQAAAAEFFDEWAESATFRRLRPWLALVQRTVLDGLDWNRTSRVLDVGCGSGLAVYLAANRIGRRRGGFAAGCDISHGMLSQRTAPPPGAAPSFFVVASAQSLPYKSASFEAILITAAFHHFPAPHEALNELRRVLAPGGTLVIGEVCRDRSLGTWIFDRLHRWFEPGHVKYYRRDELRVLLEQTGFERIELRELSPSWAEARKIVRKATLFSARAA